MSWNDKRISDRENGETNLVHWGIGLQVGITYFLIGHGLVHGRGRDKSEFIV